MGNVKRWNEMEVGNPSITDASNEERVRVILLAPADCRQAYHMTSELNLVGIAVRTASLDTENGIQMAAGLGIRYVVKINDDFKGRVHLMDIHDQQEGVMPMDQAIFVIECMYPPADFT